MYYLISQYGWWLLFALVFGLFVGYLTCKKDEPVRWGLLPLVLIVALVALVFTVLRWINGVPALWVETALLFLGFYLAGCCLGCLVRQIFAQRPQLAGVPEWNRNLSDPGPGIGAVGLVEGGVREWHKDLDGAPAAPPVALPVAEPPVALAPAPAPVAAMPKVEGEDLISGSRPLGLASPRGGRADDLKLVRGIGKQNEGRLHGLGIWHFDQIAAWTAENALWVGSYLAFPGRIEREDWIGQARALASGTETEFAARVRRGEVSTSRDDGSLGQSNVASMAEDGFEGDRPANTLAGPRGGKADDLKLINGVGRAIEQKLHQIGIWHFDQIAAMTDGELKFISHVAGFPGRALRENWKGEAATLAAGGETEHSKAVKAGKIPTSLDDPEGGKR